MTFCYLHLLLQAEWANAGHATHAPSTIDRRGTQSIITSVGFYKVLESN